MICLFWAFASPRDVAQFLPNVCSIAESGLVKESQRLQWAVQHLCEEKEFLPFAIWLDAYFLRCVFAQGTEIRLLEECLQFSLLFPGLS